MLRKAVEEGMDEYTIRHATDGELRELVLSVGDRVRLRLQLAQR